MNQNTGDLTGFNAIQDIPFGDFAGIARNAIVLEPLERSPYLVDNQGQVHAYSPQYAARPDLFKNYYGPPPGPYTPEQKVALMRLLAAKTPGDYNAAREQIKALTQRPKPVPSSAPPIQKQG